MEDGLSKQHLVIMEPTSEDILFGRGRHVVEHVANIKFRALIGLCMDRFEFCVPRGKEQDAGYHCEGLV